ncbi:MAG: hypothetical protein IJC79_05710 [Clostridia bacterium]|nr:hypothetical protein [Clostridia bacterium]
MKNKKIISLLLALMMMLSVVPMYASAAEPIALTEANVTVWPTVSGEIYYGQKINEGITLSGGEIQYEGTVVPGHFEFVEPELRTNLGIPNLKFVPDDTTSYSVSEIGYAWDLMFTINKTTPVLVDANDPPVATEVSAAGTLLGKSKISGGQVMNPYYPEESSVLGYTWSWVNRREPVTKSGYYEAQLGGGSYNTITTMIYVKIAGDTPETSIVETPTIPELNYNPDITWADVPLTGGKAVINDNEEVTGTFAISETWKDKVPAIGSYNVSVVFTPDDLTKASIYTMIIPVTVNPAPIKFVDENGAEIVPEITVDYGTEVGDYINLFKGFATNCNETLRFILADEVKNAVPTVGTHEYEVTAATFKTVGVTSNYEDTVLKFKVIVEPMELAVKFLTETGGQTNPNYYEICVTSNVLSARPQGTFAIYVDGVLLKDGLKYQERVEWPVAASKTYELKVVYTPVDNDPYIIEDYTGTIKKNLYWMFTSGKNVSGPSDLIACGATVEISANLASENFAGWKVTNAAGEEVDLGLDNTSVKATITMPDYDIHVEALEKNASSGGSGGIFDMDFGDLSEGDSEWAIINIIRNIIAMFKSFLQQLIETFQSIGD